MQPVGLSHTQHRPERAGGAAVLVVYKLAHTPHSVFLCSLRFLRSLRSNDDVVAHTGCSGMCLPFRRNAKTSGRTTVPLNWPLCHFRLSLNLKCATLHTPLVVPRRLLPLLDP